MKHNPGVAEVETDYYSRDQKGPLFGSSWYHAADYCNWLSRQEGLPECYEPNPDGRYPARMKIKPDALRLGGYRLPTEAEWEYACRAGAGTSRYYGTSVDLLGQYAWYNATSQEHAWPCGSLLPNELGLFDMLGNMDEWCQEVALIYQPDRNNIIIDRISDYLYVDDTNLRLLRGGAFNFPTGGRPLGVPSPGSSRRAGSPTSASASPGLTAELLYVFTTPKVMNIIYAFKCRLISGSPGVAGADPKLPVWLSFWQLIMP